MQRPAELEGKRSDMKPGPWREEERQRHIGDRGRQEKASDEQLRTAAQLAKQLPKRIAPSAREAVEPRGAEIEYQQHPQEPRRPAGPERQGKPMLPVGSQSGIDRGDAVDRIVGDRHQQSDYQREWHADAQQPLIEKHAAALAHEARPYKQPREKEQEGNKI